MIESSGSSKQTRATGLIVICLLFVLVVLSLPVSKQTTSKIAASSASSPSSSTSRSDTASSPQVPQPQKQKQQHAAVAENSANGNGTFMEMPPGTPRPFDMKKDVVDADLVFRPHAIGSWEQRLNTPTYVANVIGYWWIVDCWHHRVLYRKRQPNETDADLDAVSDFVNGWKKLRVPDPLMLRIPHSLATDGRVVVVESSIGGSRSGDRHSLLVFELILNESSKTELEKSTGDDFRLIQVLPACLPLNQTRRPHRVVYDAFVRAFFLYLTDPGFLSRFDRVAPWSDKTDNRLKISYCKKLPFMAGGYARSITQYGRYMYITVGPNAISKFNHRTIDNTTTNVPLMTAFYTKNWKVRRSAMNDVFFFNGFWYMTTTLLCRMFRQAKLPPLKWPEGKIAKVPQHKITSFKNKLPICRKQIYAKTDMCTGGGTPYFMSGIGDRLYVSYIFGCSGVISFVPTANDTDPVTEFKHHFRDMGWTETLEDLPVRGRNGEDW